MTILYLDSLRQSSDNLLSQNQHFLLMFAVDDLARSQVTTAETPTAVPVVTTSAVAERLRICNKAIRKKIE